MIKETEEVVKKPGWKITHKKEEEHQQVHKAGGKKKWKTGKWNSYTNLQVACKNLR